MTPLVTGNGVDPSLNLQKPKALYSLGDMRENICNIDLLPLEEPFVEKVKNQAKSVACLINRNFLINKSSSYLLHPKSPKHSDPKRVEIAPSKFEVAPLGENEPFTDEYSPGSATAFLVGKRYMLTAGHCVCKSLSNNLDESKITTMRVVFEFQQRFPKQKKHSFLKKDVYEIKKVVAWNNGAGSYKSDWALLKLDREVKDRIPLPLETMQEEANGIELYMLGHPSGLPLKFTRDGSVQRERSKDISEVKIDAYSGNSGSPVFNRKTQEVSGILVAGNDDYEISQNYQGTGKKRAQNRHLTATDVANYGYERCQKIRTLEFVSHYLDAKKGNKDAQHLLAIDYINGFGGAPKNLKKGLQWLEKSAYLGNAAALRQFNELSEDKIENVEPSASEEKKNLKGFTIEGECVSESCSEKKVFRVHKGLSTFNIAKEIALLKCPSCQTQAEKVKRLIFSNCTFVGEGHKFAPKEENWKKKEVIPEGMRKIINYERNNTRWTYLQISTF